MNNDLNMQLIEQLAVASETTTTTEPSFCEHVNQAFQSKLEAYSGLILYRQQDAGFVLRIQLPAAGEDNETLTTETHATVLSAIHDQKHYMTDQDVYVPLYNHEVTYGILRLTFRDTSKYDNLHWKLIAHILNHGYEQISPDRPVKAAVAQLPDTVYQMSLAKDDEEIARSLLASLPDAISHIALYTFDPALMDGGEPDSVRMQVIAARDTEPIAGTVIDFSAEAPFSGILTTKLINGKSITIDQMKDATDQLSPALVDSVQTTPIQSFMLYGLRASEKLVGLILFGSQQSAISKLQYDFRALSDQIGIIYENRSLLQNTETAITQLREQIQTQRLVNELATFVSTNQDEKLLFDKGAETLLKVLKVDHVGIMMIDEGNKVANLVSDFPPQETPIRQVPVEGEIWENLARGEHQTVVDINTTEGMAETSKKSLEAMHIRSSLFMPFIDLSGKLIGSIGLDQFSGRIALTDEQIQTARLITAQIVTQLQNVRLLRDSQRYASQMQQIAKYGETVQSRLGLEEILQTTIHFAQRILNIDYVSIVLYEETHQKLIVKAFHLNGRDVVLPTDTPTMPVDQTVVGEVWKKRESIYVQHLDQSAYSHPLATDITSLYAVALISRGVNRGALEIGSKESNGIASLDRSVLIQLANQLTVALDNAATYTQSQRLAQNKVLANEIALQLQQQMDMDGLINTTVNELGKALGAKRARIRLGIQNAQGEI